jgi:hypothetical protein
MNGKQLMVGWGRSCQVPLQGKPEEPEITYWHGTLWAPARTPG